MEGIAYQQNVGEHKFEENEEQRYIKFVRGEILSNVPEPNSQPMSEEMKISPWIATDE